MLVEEPRVLRAGAGAGRVAPQRRDRGEHAVRDELRLGLRVLDREVQVGGRGHVEHGCLDRAQRRRQVAGEGRGGADVVRLPGAHLPDQVVGVRTGEELRRVARHGLVEGGAGRHLAAPQLAAPPLLRVQPGEPDQGGGLDAAGGLGGVVAAGKGGVGRDRRDPAVEADDAVAVGLRGAGGGDDAVHEVGVADRPLQRLLRAHGEADHRAQVAHVQAVHQQAARGLHVVADRDRGEAGAVERLGRVAGRGGAAVAEHLGRDQEQPARVERAAGADQPVVAVQVGHVVRGQQHGVVAGRVQGAEGRVHDPGIGQRHAGLGGEGGQRELLAQGVGRLGGGGGGGQQGGDGHGGEAGGHGGAGCGGMDGRVPGLGGGRQRDFGCGQEG